jgi:hypothetical protein
MSQTYRRLWRSMRRDGASRRCTLDPKLHSRPAPAGLFLYAIAWLSVRSPQFQSVIKAMPTLLLRRGRFLQAAMRAERVTREEWLAAVRASGAADPGEVAAVVLETDGSLSVRADTHDTGRLPALDTVRRLDDASP